VESFVIWNPLDIHSAMAVEMVHVLMRPEIASAQYRYSTSVRIVLGSFGGATLQ